MPDAAEIITLIDKLRGVVEEKSPSAQKGSWVSKAILAGIAVLAVFVYAWFEWKRGRELAALRHEKTLNEVAAANHAVALANSNDLAVVVKAQANIEKVTANMATTEARIEELETRRKKDADSIAAIRSWSDLGG